MCHSGAIRHYLTFFSFLLERKVSPIYAASFRENEIEPLSVKTLIVQTLDLKVQDEIIQTSEEVRCWECKGSDRKSLK